MPNLIDETGNVYTRLTVIERAGNSSGGMAKWRCRCECGNITDVIGTDLRSGNTKSCGCYNTDIHTLPNGVASFNALLNVYRQMARKYEREWQLSAQEFGFLTKQPCHYCGAEPTTIIDKGGNGAYMYNGIDRANNAKGYTPNNCVSCCKDCNIAKRDRPIPEFLAWAERIHNQGLRNI